jgi:hypothetical protein
MSTWETAMLVGVTAFAIGTVVLLILTTTTLPTYRTESVARWVMVGLLVSAWLVIAAAVGLVMTQ